MRAGTGRGRRSGRPRSGLLRWGRLRPGLLALAAGLLVLAPARTPLAAQEQPVRVADDSVFFNFRDLEIPAALESISRVLGLNYVLSGEIGGTLTMRTRTGIPRAEVPRVLETVLSSQDLRMERRGNVYVVSPGAEGPAGEPVPRREIFVFFLENADAVEMANMLVTLFGGETGRFQRRGGLEEDRALSRQLRTFQLPSGELARPAQQAAPARPEAPPQGTARGELVGGLTVVPDERTNSVVVRTAPENREALERTIEKLDRRPLQVLIEVVIAEVTLDDRTQFGVDFETFFGSDPEGEVRGDNRGELAGSAAGIVASVFSPERVDAVFRALATEDRLNVLSTPRVLATNNEEARILIGSEVPFVQVRSFGGTTAQPIETVQFRDVGLELNVVPRINREREVTLEVLQQNSSLSSTSFGNLDAPTITTREAETSLVVGNGRSVVLGGLIETQRQRQVSGIPLLKDVPLLGGLFRSTDTRQTKRELIITLTPYIVGSDREAEELRRRLEDQSEWMEEHMDGDRFLTPDSVRLRLPSPDTAAPPGDGRIGAGGPDGGGGATTDEPAAPPDGR